jgi:hypothetical protein
MKESFDIFSLVDLNSILSLNIKLVDIKVKSGLLFHTSKKKEMDQNRQLFLAWIPVMNRSLFLSFLNGGGRFIYW